MEHVGAQVLDESSVFAPGLPSPAQGSVLKAQRLCWDQAHIHRPEVALGLGLCRVPGHLGSDWFGCGYPTQRFRVPSLAHTVPRV